MSGWAVGAIRAVGTGGAQQQSAGGCTMAGSRLLVLLLVEEVA